MNGSRFGSDWVAFFGSVDDGRTKRRHPRGGTLGQSRGRVPVMSLSCRVGVLALGERVVVAAAVVAEHRPQPLERPAAVVSARRSTTRPVSRRRSRWAFDKPVNCTGKRRTTPVSPRPRRPYPNRADVHCTSSQTDSRSTGWHSSDPSPTGERIPPTVFTRRRLISTIILP